MQGPAFCQYFIQKKGRWDTDSDSGKGPSIYTKSSTISEVSMARNDALASGHTVINVVI